MANHGITPDPIDYIYYNTVSISGTASSGAQLGMGFYRGDFSVTARTQTVVLKITYSIMPEQAAGKH